MALSEIHCIGKNWLLERYPHKHRKHDRHIFFCFLGFSVLFFKYFVLLEDVSIFRVSDFSSRLSFKCAQMCNFFFCTTRVETHSPHHTPLHLVALTRTHPLLWGTWCMEGFGCTFSLFWKFVGFRLFACRFFVCGARPWYLAKDCMYRNCMYAFAFRRGLASTLCHKTFGAVFLEFHVFCGLRV